MSCVFYVTNSESIIDGNYDKIIHRKYYEMRYREMKK